MRLLYVARDARARFAGRARGRRRAARGMAGAAQSGDLSRAPRIGARRSSRRRPDVPSSATTASSCARPRRRRSRAASRRGSIARKPATIMSSGGTRRAQARRARDDGPAADRSCWRPKGRARGVAGRARIRTMEDASRRRACGRRGAKLTGSSPRPSLPRGLSSAANVAGWLGDPDRDRDRARRARRRASAWRALRHAGPCDTLARRAGRGRGGDRARRLDSLRRVLGADDDGGRGRGEAAAAALGAPLMRPRPPPARSSGANARWC